MKAQVRIILATELKQSYLLKQSVLGQLVGLDTTVQYSSDDMELNITGKLQESITCDTKYIVVSQNDNDSHIVFDVTIIESILI